MRWPSRHRKRARPFAGQYILSVEVATVGDLEFVCFEHFFGLLRHPSKLPTVVADVYDLVRNNQMVFDVHHDLDVVTDDTRSIEPASGTVSDIC
jgi:hypothetical protein